MSSSPSEPPPQRPSPLRIQLLGFALLLVVMLGWLLFVQNRSRTLRKLPPGTPYISLARPHIPIVSPADVPRRFEYGHPGGFIRDYASLTSLDPPQSQPIEPPLDLRFQQQRYAEVYGAPATAPKPGLFMHFSGRDVPPFKIGDEFIPLARTTSVPPSFRADRLTTSTTQPFTAMDATARIELAALAIYQRDPQRPAGDGPQPLLGVFRPGGEPLTTATLIGSGVPPAALPGELGFKGNDQVLMTALWRFELPGEARLLNFAMLDERLRMPLTIWERHRMQRPHIFEFSGDTPTTHGQQGQWGWLQFAPNLLSSRPVRLQLDLAVLEDQAREIPATTGTTLASGPYAQRTQALMHLFIPPPGDFFDFLQLSAFEYVSGHRCVPKPHELRATVVMQCEPPAAAGAASLEALDQAGRTIPAVREAFGELGWLCLALTTHTLPTTLRVRMPSRLLRAEFSLPAVPGLPPLPGNDLLAQRLQRVQCENPSHLAAVIYRYGHYQMAWNWEPPAGSQYRLEFQDITLAELTYEIERQMLRTDTYTVTNDRTFFWRYDWVAQESAVKRWRRLCKDWFERTF